MQEGEMSIPHLFICPISLDLFKDPVTLCTGQTYDRSSIQKWISSGNFTCPVTMLKLHDLTMVPNHTLHHLINQWLHMPSSTHPSFHSLKHTLQSHHVHSDKKLDALEKILSLCQESTLVHLGFLHLLLEMLFGKVESEMSQESIKFAEKSVSCILQLVQLGESECLNILKEESKLESFRILVEQGNSKIKEGLCYLLEVIAASQETRELCVMVCENQRFLSSLIQNVEEIEGGIKAISALCLVESKRQNLIEVGVVEALLRYISNAERRERKWAPKAMAAIEVLLELESGKEVVKNRPNGVEAIVKMVFRVSDHQGSESAVKSLIIICTDSVKAREGCIHAGLLTQLLLLLQSQCNGRTKTRARMLLKLLRSNWNQHEEQH
ncbi:U-box domain-containing protein 26-like [Euphorbia lathyris]|uniref:U-box domain-containing protein 26-like n=1 Tax=Euphorbia lathyris TaxID=212925 RepID=UPI003313F2FA